MLKYKKVSILGCGWLGFPLAQFLIKRGYVVKGSSTTLSKLESLRDSKITPFLIKLPTPSAPQEFFDADILIINIPPQTRSKDKDHHLHCIESFINQIKTHTKVLYISATSVYPAIDQEITENQPVNRESDRAKALWQVEELLQETFKNKLTIIRMGGLLGYDRIPGRYYAGKEISNAEQKVNYIHRDDAIGIIDAVLEKKLWDDLFNGVAPIHPTRKEVFKLNAEELGFTPPVITPEKSTNTYRFISGSKIAHKADYSFIYPDPRRFHYTY